jgi:glycosyltransferase involved in cell wall biosynthesis
VQQSRPPDEIVLVDAGSRDQTVQTALTVDLPRPLKIVRAPRVFPGIARNAGVSAAQFDWIAFTDGGIVLHSEWLRELLNAVAERTDVVFGDVDPICDSFFRQCAAIAYVPPRGRHGTRGPFIASSLIRRAAFLHVGTFPPYRAAEDLILIRRLQAAGASFAYAPKAQVEWEIAGSPSATFRRFATYSYHNLVAGWGRHWHAGVARLYGLLAVVMVGMHVLGLGYLAGLALALFFLTRAAKAAWLKRRSFTFSTLHLGRILGAAGVLAVIDAATAAGLAHWLRAKVRP